MTMPPDADYVTAREFDLLRAQVENAGSVPALAAQLAEVIKDVGQLQTDVAGHRAEHQAERQRADDEARARARFRVGSSIAAVAASSAVLALLVDIAARLH